MKTERRIIREQPITLRKAENGAKRLTGYAAVFNREATIGGYFREQIAPGAFAKAIAEDDVRALFNHNPDYVLGRNTAKTLTLTEDDNGLSYDVDPPDTQWANDLMVSIARGDVNQSSFGFTVTAEKWEESEDRSAPPLRTILEARLFDVSPVTYPAYEETTAEARSHAEALAKAPDVLAKAADAAAMGATVIRQKRQDILEGTL